MSPMPETQFARNGNVDLAYQVWGSGDRNIAAISGFVSHIEVMWELPEFVRTLERIGEWGRTVSYDRRGAGMSDRAAVATTLEDHVSDLGVVLDAAEMESATLIAYVDAGAIATAFAAWYPHRVDALVLYSFVARPAVTFTPDLLDQFEQSISEGWGQAQMVPALAPSAANDERVIAWFRRWERMSATPNAAAAAQRWVLELDSTPVLPAVRAPTLAIHRPAVLSVPADAVRATAEAIAGARYVELPGSDFYPFFEGADTVLNEMEEFVTGSRRAAQDDRVLATVLFTDIVGSTERARELGDARWSTLLATHNQAIRSELDHFGGTEVKTTGDGFFATFPGPARAVRCACAIRATLEQLGVDVRIGVHTGEVEPHGDDFVGIAVHVGARVMAEAGAREVLVTSTVKELVLGSGIKFEDRGLHRLKGVDDEWRLYAVAD